MVPELQGTECDDNKTKRHSKVPPLFWTPARNHNTASADGSLGKKTCSACVFVTCWTNSRPCNRDEVQGGEEQRRFSRGATGWFGCRFCKGGVAQSLALEQIQRKIRVRGSTPENAPRIRAGMEKKEQKPELNKNQTRRCYAEKNLDFFPDNRQTPARREARNHRSEDAVP